MPEYFATCLWSACDSAYEKFGVNIKYEHINLSKTLIMELEQFDSKIMELVDWNNPGGNCPLSYQERQNIWEQGQVLIGKIRSELGDDIEVIDESAWIK